MSPHRCNCLQLIFGMLLALIAASGHAQGVTFSSSSGAGTVLVSQKEVLNNAESAYAATTDHQLKKLISTQKYDRFQKSLQRIRTGFIHDFSNAARHEIEKLKGDGILKAEEVSHGLGGLRERYIQQFSEAVQATVQGYSVPPVPRNFSSSLAYSRALLDYTLADRNPLQRWIYLAASIVAGLFAAWLGNNVLNRIGTTLKQRQHGWQAAVLNSLTGPVYLMALVIGLYFGLSRIWVPGIAHSTMDKVLYVTVMTGVFWFFWNASGAVASGIAWLIRKSYTRRVNRHVVVVISRILRVAILMIYVLVIIKVILDSDLTGVLAGLGVVGLALSFVLKGTIENVAASFTIFGDKPFRVGDLMLYKEQWGYVEDIGFRSTRFRTLDGHLINIPNAVLIDEALQNIGERPYIRRRFRVSLTYDTPPEKVREAIDIVRKILKNHSGQPDDKPPHVVFEGYGPYDLQLLIQYYYTPPDYWEALEFDTEVNLKILDQFNRAGIDFAFPTQTNRLAAEADAPIPVYMPADGNASMDARSSAQSDGERQSDL